MALLELAFFVALLRAQRLSATCTERELQRHLTSLEPPYDNYYNISRAVYPSVDLPSLLIKITVRFHQSINQSKTLFDFEFVDSKIANISEENNLTSSKTSNVPNQTGENTRQTTDNETKTYKFTWSASCLYVSGGDISLTSMNVFSLWAIYPNRREKKLDLTLPKFCRDVSLDTMIYFLSTLQDIAVLPHLPDPSLNTVECVIMDEERAQNFDGPKKLFHGVCWSILCISLFVGQLASQWLIVELRKWKETPENDSKVATVMFLSLFVFALGFGLHFFALVSQRDVYSCTFFAFVILVLFRRAGWCIHKRCRMRRTNSQCFFDWSLTEGNEKKTSTNIVSCFILYPAVFMACHHLLWILLAIITEPFWGISVLAAVLSVSAVFCFLFYDFRTHFSSFECDRKCLIALFLDLGGFFAFLLLIFELLVVGQSFLSESLITTLVQNILVVFATLTFRYLKLDPKTESEDEEGENGNQSQLQPLNTTTTTT